MSNYIKNNLSFSTDGAAIPLLATSTNIHAATASTTEWDEIWIYANNTHTESVLVVIMWADVASKVELLLPSKSGSVLIVPGLILRNSKTVTGFAGIDNKVFISGYVNSITA